MASLESSPRRPLLEHTSTLSCLEDPPQNSQRPGARCQEYLPALRSEASEPAWARKEGNFGAWQTGSDSLAQGAGETVSHRIQNKMSK